MPPRAMILTVLVTAAVAVDARSLPAQTPQRTEPLPQHVELQTYVGLWNVFVDGIRVGTATARPRVGERIVEFELMGDLGPMSRVAYVVGFDRRHDEYSVLAFDDSGDYWVSGRGPREGATVRAVGVDDDPQFDAMGLTKEFVLVVTFDSTGDAEADPPTTIRFETRFVDTRTAERREVPFLAFELRRAGGAEPSDGRAAAQEVGLDYIDAFYLGDAARISRTVHPDLVKLGFFREGAEQPYRPVPRTFQEMLDFTAAVRDGRVATPADAPREAVVLDVADQTAVVRVRAWWGHDYLQMARYHGGWKILHILWQSPQR